MDTREVDQENRIVVPRSAPNGTSKTAPEPPADAGGETKAAPPRRRLFFIAGGIVALVVILWFGVPWLLYALSHQGTDDARVDADVVAVTSKISERINQILVTTNQPVHKGQLLMILDNRDELYRLQQARAQFDLAMANQRTTTLQNQGGVTQAAGNAGTADAQVPVAQAGVGQAQAQLSVAIAEVPAAQAAYAKAEADYQRTVSLVHSGDIAAQQLDAARAAQAAAASQLRGAQDQVSAAESNVAASVARVTASSAGASAAQGGVTTAQGKLQQAADPSQVESAKAQLDLAKANLGYTRIYSPIDGYVGEKSAEQGQVIGAGATLMTLVPNDIYITANYKETQMGGMRVGQKVDIKVDAYKGVTFQGHVESINPASQNTYALVPAQNATGNFVKVTQRIPVRISIDNPRSDMPLRPGMSVETYVATK